MTQDTCGLAFVSTEGGYERPSEGADAQAPWFGKYIRKFFPAGVPIMARQVKNPASIHEDVGSIPGLAQWVKDLVLP